MKVDDGETGRRFGVALGLVLMVVGAALGAGVAAAGEGAWTVEVQPVYVEVRGHEQHVLTERRSAGAEKVELETDSTLGYRAAALYDRGRWTYGLDSFIHRTEQLGGPLRQAASSAADPLRFELPRRSFESTGPGQNLFYQTLEDTTVELWVVDLYAKRKLGAGEDGPWAFLVGLRNADFDNDYRAIGGIEGVGGSRIDASSNYSRMIGPLAGLAGSFGHGRHRFEVTLLQSVVFGDIELSRTLRDFAGPPGPFAGPPEEVPPGANQERLHATDHIEVPMTDLRLAWRLRLGERFTFGARVDATTWWGLAVPPGVVPDRPLELEETDLTTLGAGITLGLRF